jgi:hypothetical protein
LIPAARPQSGAPSERFDVRGEREDTVAPRQLLVAQHLIARRMEEHAKSADRHGRPMPGRREGRLVAPVRAVIQLVTRLIALPAQARIWGMS